MRGLIKKCPKCNLYTIQDRCKVCKNKTVSPHPAKFSLQDKYSRYKIIKK
ncbi:MAG: RNA-protein complex protein Nop10 [Candidatus Bathyarchaeota archaeon]|nr:RNA-protein complex protein Nop10 [Candidatus Bathyarchaeota archaeon]